MNTGILHKAWRFGASLILGLASLGGSVGLAAQGAGPHLVSVVPANGATAVSTTAGVVLTFSEEMDPAQSQVLFVNTTSFSIVEASGAWSANNTVVTYTANGAGWPANATIQWSASEATSAAGEPLDFFSGLLPVGTFTTGGGGGGGGTDTTPPVLSSSLPPDGTKDVPVDTAIRFNFNEAMQSAQQISWSANVNAANISYLWSTDQRTLTCRYNVDLPTNAVITWALNPNGQAALFKDAAGNALASGTYSGSFTTSRVACHGGDTGDDGLGAFSLSKSVRYEQTGSTGSVEVSDTPAIFNASLASPTNNPVTGAQLSLPGGGSLTLSNFFSSSSFIAFGGYDSQVLLDQARPAGTYTLQVNRTTGGAQTLSLTTAAGDWPPTPEILNLVALQSAPAATDFVVQWNGFPTAGAADSIYFTISDDSGVIFDAPNECVPRELSNRATSITVPQGTLAAGQSYSANLTFTHFGPFNTNTIADIPAYVILSKSLDFTLKTSSGGTTPQSPTIGAVVAVTGGIQFQVSGAAPNQQLQIQWAPTVPSTHWTVLQTVTADGSGSAPAISDPAAAAAGTRFYRIVTP